MSNFYKELEKIKCKDLKEKVERLTNSKDAKYDSGKLHLSYVPSDLIYAVAYIREYGNAKYHDPTNWKLVDSDRYVEALLRHTELFKQNPRGMDAESGLPHLWHIGCNVAFLCYKYARIFSDALEVNVTTGEPIDFYKVSPYFAKKDWLKDMYDNQIVE